MGDFVLILNSSDEELRNFVVQRFVDNALNVKLCAHPDKHETTALILSASQNVISKEAEAWGFLKRDETGFKREYVSSEHERFQIPYTLQGEKKCLFTPSEISYITFELIKRVAIHVVPDYFPRSKAGVHSTDSMLLALERAEISECWPLHSAPEDRLAASSVGPWKRSFLDHIEQYFGVNVALYFAWLKNYIVWLLVPAILGLIVYGYHSLHPEINVDNSLVSPIYTLIIIIWGVLFVKGWDRDCAALVCDWGIDAVKWRREVRPRYHGTKRISPITGLPERHFPSEQRIFRYLGSSLVTLLMLILAFSVMVISLNLQGYIHSFSYSKNYLLYPSIAWLCDEGQYFDPSGKGPMPQILLYIPVILHAVIIQVLNKIYQVVAINLTHWENHRSPARHENALFIKRFFFEAFDCYIALFYLAFVEADIVLLRKELLNLFIVDCARRLATESLIPFIARKASRKISKKQTDCVIDMRLGEDYDKAEYEQFDDYLEMVIQIGYITLFAGAFPLAAPLSLVCNVLELYSDIFKLSRITRRPVVHRIVDIGVWSLLVKGIVLLSVFTNLYIFCFTSEQLMTYVPSLFEVTPLSAEAASKAGSDHIHDIAAGAGTTVTTIMISLEHIILILVAAIWILVPGISSSVQNELARRQYVKFIEVHGEAVNSGGISAMNFEADPLERTIH